jgi:hypothetical protein
VVRSGRQRQKRLRYVSAEKFASGVASRPIAGKRQYQAETQSAHFAEKITLLSEKWVQAGVLNSGKSLHPAGEHGGRT